MEGQKPNPGPQEQGPTPTSPTSTGISPNVAGLLCYLFGWVSGLIFVLIEKEDKTIRFHALQSIFLNIALFVIWIGLMIIFGILAAIPGLNVVSFVLLPIVSAIFWLGFLALWIVLMVRAYQGEKFKLPIIGNLAEQYA